MGIEIGVTSLGLAERIEFFRTLGTWLVAAGGSMPVHEGLRNTCDVFSRDEYYTLRAPMEKISRDYMSGQVPLVDALAKSQLGFTSQELAIVGAAEQSNQLRLAIPALVDALSMRYEARKSLVGKLTMPLVGGFMLILMSLGVMIFMLPLVMGPVIARDPDKLEKFPLIIKAYWYSSLWLRDHYSLVVLVVSLPVILFLMRNTDFLRPRLESLFMSVTPIRRLLISFNAVLIVYFMPALVRASIPMHQVLLILAGTLNNMTICAALRQAAREHEMGYRLGDSLAGVPLKGSFRSAVEAGEKTGKIADRIEDLKGPYAGDFDRISRRFTGTLMFVVMAILVPFFMISVYTALVAPMISLMEYSR